MLRFPGPNQDMLLATGVLVQTYNYIELNLRRCVETFIHAKLLTGSSWARKPTSIRSARLVEIVKEALVRMTPVPADLQDWTAKLDEISLRWRMRHMFAHWAIRRVPNEDCIILMTNDAREVKKLHERSKGKLPPILGLGEVRYAIMDAADVCGVCVHMQSYETWIAQKTADWYKQYAES